MQLTDFYYTLPKSQIAKRPLPERCSSRLLCLDGNNGAIKHQQFSDILSLLRANDLLVFNNTKVIPARLFGQKETGGKVEILVERVLDDGQILAMVRASKALKPHSKIHINKQVALTVLEKNNEFYVLQLNKQQAILDILTQYGTMPLPPYMERAAETFDEERYQTIYAKHPGAVAAPTAGLHFDEDLLKKMENKGVQTGFVTLHVGAGTFQPVRVKDIKQHQMHSEYFEVSAALCNKIKKTKEKGGRVIAVGTTTVRSLESLAQKGELKPYQGETDIFIYPGFEFKVIDAMITNFHLPESTLLMLVCAFAGYKNVMSAYEEAIANQYRFYSYGDAMFVIKDKRN